MHSALAHALLTKGVIQVGTVIDALQSVKSLSCERDARVMAPFIVQKATLIESKRVVFDVIQHPNTQARIAAELVMRVDGMDIERLAICHNLTTEGVALTAGVRRGRRRKVRTDAS